MAVSWRLIPRQEISASQTLRLELTQYLIDRGSAIPTISIQPQEGTASIDTGTPGQIFLVWTMPGTTTESNDSLQLSITRDGVTAMRYVTAIVHQASQPSWTVVPTQEVLAGQAWTLDMSTWLTGEPTPTLSFQTGFLEPTWLTISGTTLTGTPNFSDYAPGDSSQINLTATNASGSANVRFTINYVVPLPAQSGFSGEPWTFNVASHIPHGDMVSLRPGYSRPQWLTLSGTTLSAVALPAVALAQQDDTYTIQLRGTRGASTYDFNVPLTVKWATSPQFLSIPVQVLDEPVTPNIQANPPMVTSLSLDLRDYLTPRSGSVFEFTLLPATPSWATLDADGHTLHMTSPEVVNAPAGQIYQNFEVLVAVRNAFGRSAATINVHVNELALPHISRIPSQTVYRDEVDTLDLNPYGTGFPAPTFALGTINPPLAQSVATITSNADGHWSIHPNTALAADSTHNVQVYVRNRVGTAFILMTLNLKGSDAPQPPIAPVWKSGDALIVSIDTGATQTIDLSRLIARARPAPTFAISDATDITNLDGTVTLNGSQLTIVAPAVTADITKSVHLTATNSAGSTNIALTVNIADAEAPVWGDVPAVNVEIGTAFSVNLAQYVTSESPVTFAYAPGDVPTGWLAWLALSADGVLSGTPSGTNQDWTTVHAVRATNPQGFADLSLTVHIHVVEAPVWLDEPIILSVLEEHSAEWDLTPFLTAGRPTPVISFKEDFVQDDFTVSLADGIFKVLDAPPVDVDTDFTFSFTARNASGSVNKDIDVRVLSQFFLNQVVSFSSADYDNIRALLDHRLEKTELTDAQIGRAVFEEAAISWCKSELPFHGQGTRSRENHARQKRAALYRCAGNIAPTMPQLLYETVGAISSQYEQMGWSAKQAVLYAMAQTEILIVREDESGEKEIDDLRPTNYTFIEVLTSRPRYSG